MQPTAVDRKYKWTAEVKGCGGVERKHMLGVEVKAREVEEKSCKWRAEVRGKGADGPITKTYAFRSSASAAAGGAAVKKEKRGRRRRPGWWRSKMPIQLPLL